MLRTTHGTTAKVRLKDFGSGCCDRNRLPETIYIKGKMSWMCLRRGKAPDGSTCRREPRSLSASACTAANGIAETTSTPTTSCNAAVGPNRAWRRSCLILSCCNRLPRGPALPVLLLCGRMPPNVSCRSIAGFQCPGGELDPETTDECPQL